jgi:hypothetical protein
MLRTLATAATWTEEIPLYSSASAHSQGKTLVFLWQRQFLLLQLSCQMNFCEAMKFLLILLKKFSKALDAPAFSLPRHSSSTLLPSKLPAKLLTTPPRLGMS